MPRSPANGRAENLDPTGVRELRQRILRWYRRHRRDLPWRRTGDPYAIWVSETMLQQTQVATVVPYYRRFLERFPDPASLARASEEEVLAAWSGLGYYRRARALRAAARMVVERHRGRLPREPRVLRELPGVGRYTAGAIASIAFDSPEPVLDGNVRRVLSRLFAVRGRDGGRAAGDRRLWSIAGTLVRGPDPGSWNQALMELGALVCTPRGPRCRSCPVRASCRALRAGNPEAYPATRPTRASEKVRVAVAWVTRADRMLIERPAAGNPLRGVWDLPAVELPPGIAAAEAIHRRMAREHGLDVAVGEPMGRSNHGIMHRRLLLDVYACRLRRGRVAGRSELRWLERTGLDATAVSGATRKVARIVYGPSKSESV